MSILHLRQEILLKNEQKCFSTAFTNLLTSCFEELLSVDASKT